MRLPTPPCLAVMLHIWDQVPSGCLNGPSQILQRVDQPRPAPSRQYQYEDQLPSEHFT